MTTAASTHPLQRASVPSNAADGTVDDTPSSKGGYLPTVPGGTPRAPSFYAGPLSENPGQSAAVSRPAHDDTGRTLTATRTRTLQRTPKRRRRALVAFCGLFL